MIYKDFNSSRRELYNDKSSSFMALVVSEFKIAPYFGTCPEFCITYMSLISSCRYIANDASKSLIAIVFLEFKIFIPSISGPALLRYRFHSTQLFSTENITSPFKTFDENSMHISVCFCVAGWCIRVRIYICVRVWVLEG